MLVYIISSGIIIAKIPRGQPYNYLYEGEELATYQIDSSIDLEKNIIINNELIELTDIEILEIREYGKILSEEERTEKELLDKLKPSHEEIKKAENIIVILEVLSGVLE